MSDQHRRTEQRGIGEGDDHRRYCFAATVVPKPRDARLQRIAGPQIRPLFMVPTRNSGNELLVICKIVNVHSRPSAPERNKKSAGVLRAKAATTWMFEIKINMKT